jgi:glycerol-3-phosphate acyltransferase PlsY
MEQILNILLIIGAYLVGSIPSSIWIGKLFFKTDIRNHGSGNAGTTNAFRVFGSKIGIIVFFVDLLKGVAAISLVHLNTGFTENSGSFITFQLILGVMAILGHIFPVYANFRGGKGVATLFGVMLGISFIPTLIAGGIFFITLLLTRYVSLSSMLAGISFPLINIFIFNPDTTSFIVFSLIIPIALILTHQKNIGRLLKNEESKANLSKIGL